MPRTPDEKRPLLAVCYGTRPQVIKASVLVEALEQRFEVMTLDTGQHYEHEVNALLHEQLGLRFPNYMLDAWLTPAGGAIETIRGRAAKVLKEHPVKAVVVIGDTNSTVGCALAADGLDLPVVHIEAGLRAPGSPMAEETNRRVVDAMSSLLCAPSAHAVANLVAEQLRGRIALTGDIAFDVLLRNIGRAGRIADEDWWPLPRDAPFVLATLHRAELVEAEALLESALTALGSLTLPVVLPVHPRLRAALARYGFTSALAPSVHLVAPLGYLQALAALREAEAVVTDSGGVQREAYWLGTPCVTLRDQTEWVETVACGANTLVPPDRARAELSAVVERIVLGPRRLFPSHRTAYGSGDAGPRIAEAVDRFLKSGG
ncbi:MAG TPA: UDP-N-acetylglucosamine 2-epimerase (non-hydrolyzing) [Gemmatimonadales bacterium]